MFDADRGSVSAIEHRAATSGAQYSAGEARNLWEAEQAEEGR
jgi:hypothetical protein